MNLRFEVDQAECFRRGIDCPKSVVTIEVEPAKLDKELRDLIARRMVGIDVMRLQWVHVTRENEQGVTYMTGAKAPGRSSERVKAMEPTLDGLIEAVRADEIPFAAPVVKPQPIMPK